MTDELIDILDSKGNPTGSRLMKSEAHANGLWHYSVHVWIFNSRGEVLLQKRAMSKDTFPGLWDISSAGHVSAGETPNEAAVRELGEELGIKAKTGDLKRAMVRELESEPRPGLHNNEHVHVYFLKFEGDAKSLKIQKKELEEVKFILLDEFEADLKDKEKKKAYAPNSRPHDYFLEIIRAIRKELEAEKS